MLMLAYTGLRWGEAAGLRVRDLDLLRKRATFYEYAMKVSGEIVVGTLKNHKHASVPLPKFLVAELARACAGNGQRATGPTISCGRRRRVGTLARLRVTTRG
ncbi:hypothetical protein [Rhodococcus sp. NPDC057529]|uniref:hypothetical protein n=1 Tax=Rhodococcus sp. NPDC057529 TaxID=3346158 RepID=UPI00366E93D9